MSIESHKQKISYSVDEDPIWLFEQDFVEESRTIFSPERKKMRFGWILIFGTIVFILSLGIFFHLNSEGTVEKAIFYLVELRSIDSQGHPVAGAKVKIAGINGDSLTDSFGEWRKFVKLVPGEVLDVRVSKDMKNVLLEETKRLVVPERQKSGKEPSLTVNIIFRKPLKNGIAATSSAANLTKKNFGTDAKDFEQTIKGTRSFKENLLSSAAVIALLPKTQQENLRPKYQRISEEILPELKLRLSELGISIVENGADFTVYLNYVPLDKDEGMIKVDASWELGDERGKTAFIREFSLPKTELVNRIINNLKVHIPKTYQIYREGQDWFVMQPSKGVGMWGLTPGKILIDDQREVFPITMDSRTKNYERLKLMVGDHSRLNAVSSEIQILKNSTVREAPPLTGWRPLRMKINEPLPVRSQVFVSGYLAYSIGNRNWEYWGVPGESHNVTIIDGGKVWLRERVRDIVGGVAVLNHAKLELSKSQIVKNPSNSKYLKSKKVL